MWRSSRNPVLLYLTGALSVRTSSPPFSFPFSSTICTAAETPKEQSFTVNHLINSFGFSPESALSASNYIRFHTSQNPDSVVAFFRSYGFSDFQIHLLVRKAPKLLISNSAKTLLPKLHYLQSKGASSSQLIHFVICNPGFLLRSLENRLIPNYNLLRDFLLSDERTIATIKRNPFLLTNDNLQYYITFMLDIGIRKPCIVMLLRNWPCLINCHIDSLRNKIDEIRELGLDPSKAAFVPAMYAKALPKSMWESKVKLYKKWGWTDEAIREAFMKHPFCMLISERKIEEEFNYFVNHLGWEPLGLARYPVLLSLSLKKRIIPRAAVLQLLLSRDRIKGTKNLPAYYTTEKKFLQKYVTCFKDDAPELLKLYEEKMNLS